MRVILLSLLLSANTYLNAQALTGFGLPTQIPTIFASGQISTGLYERDFALSPDGSELFYTLQSPGGVFQTIVYRKKDEKGSWSEPVIAPFAGHYSDLEPAFSPDGNTIFFSSNRPLSGKQIKDFDIWIVKKEKGIWGKPENAGKPVNTSADEFYPSPTRSGNLYFTAAYANSVGKEDIYIAKWEQGKYATPEPMDTTVNSAMYEFNAFVSPAEDYIIFTSYGRKDDKGRGDLYISIKNNEGKWLRSKNLSILNSDRLDYCPFVSPDGKILFFTSERMGLQSSYPNEQATLSSLIKEYVGAKNGSGDIYWVRLEELMDSLRKDWQN